MRKMALWYDIRWLGGVWSASKDWRGCKDCIEDEGREKNEKMTTGKMSMGLEDEDGTLFIPTLTLTFLEAWPLRFDLG